MHKVVLLLLVLASAQIRAWTATTRSTYLNSELTTYNAGLSAGMRAEKYAAMDADVFAFYRGTAHLFWKDLGQAPGLATFNSSSTRCWLSGDAHVVNIGAFANDQGTVVFDLNDFDESLIADYQLDVMRMAVSLNLMMIANGNIGSAADRLGIFDTFAESYLDWIEDFHEGPVKPTSKVVTADNTEDDADSGYEKAFLTNFLADAEDSNTRKTMLDKYCTPSAAPRTFQTNNPDLGPISASEYSAVLASMAAYYSSLNGAGQARGTTSTYYKVKDIKQRLQAGVGSLGVKRYYVLLEGPSSSSQNDDVILDFKAQTQPSAFLNVGPAAKSVTNSVSGSNPALRVVLGYRALGYQVDNHLGWTTVVMTNSPSYYSVRERSPWKETFDISSTNINSVSDAQYMADKYGMILATAHARADADSSSSGIGYQVEAGIYAKINGKHAQFRANLHALVDGYVTQVVNDYNAYKVLRQNGLLQVQVGGGGEDATLPPSLVAEGSINSGLVVGAVVGSVSGVAVFLLAIALGIKRRAKSKASSDIQQPSNGDDDENESTVATQPQAPGKAMSPNSDSGVAVLVVTALESSNSNFSNPLLDGQKQ